MYAVFLFLMSIGVFLFSHYTHFVHEHAFDHMVAFVGKQHVRMFEHKFAYAHADLWAFGHRKRRSARVQFGVAPFETFRDYDYKQMLLLYELHVIPMMYSEDVLEYVKANKTVASLWPYLDEWPDTVDDALAWYKQMGGRVTTIHL